MTEDKEQNRPKSLNARIEDLVIAMERIEKVMDKRFSVRSALMRGVAQGLGIIIGSTIVAGILYATLTKFISPELIQSLLLENVIEKVEKQK